MAIRNDLSLFASPAGWCALVCRDDVLLSLTFGHADPDSALARLGQIGRDCRSARRASNQLARRIAAMLEGEPDEFRDVQIDLSGLTPFARRVVNACRRIRWGQTRSYRELAVAAGSPGAARAVGQVMASNRMPLVVPCHRVIGSGGTLGGYSAPQGLVLKRRLLTLESGRAAVL